MVFMLPPFAMIQLRHSGVWTEQTWSGHKDAPGDAHLLILETYFPGPTIPVTDDAHLLILETYVPGPISTHFRF